MVDATTGRQGNGSPGAGSGIGPPERLIDSSSGQNSAPLENSPGVLFVKEIFNYFTYCIISYDMCTK